LCRALRKCRVGFLESFKLMISFILGTSSSLFNEILLNLPSGNETVVEEILGAVLEEFSADEEDIAVYPNPFKGVTSSSNTAFQYPNLTLVDGVLSNDE
jgi:lysophospholipase